LTFFCVYKRMETCKAQKNQHNDEPVADEIQAEEQQKAENQADILYNKDGKDASDGLSNSTETQGDSTGTPGESTGAQEEPSHGEGSDGPGSYSSSDADSQELDWEDINRKLEPQALMQPKNLFHDEYSSSDQCIVDNMNLDKEEFNDWIHHLVLRAQRRSQMERGTEFGKRSWGTRERNMYRNLSTLSMPKIRGALNDHLPPNVMIKKRKFRLLLNPVVRAQLEREFPQHYQSLELKIEAKFSSLGIPVEVEAYNRLDKHKTSDKTFTVIFNSARAAKCCLNLIKYYQLDFKMREARPSPNYHVKFVVLRQVSLYGGKCFGQRIRVLQRRDIVTANQERGNKLRIVKLLAHGSNENADVHGWVLHQTKEEELLRRCGEVAGEVVTPRHLRKRIPKAAGVSPYRVLSTVEVLSNGNTIAWLEPGTVVWVDQQKGATFRIMRMNQRSNLEVWGWVLAFRNGKKLLEPVPRVSSNHAERPLNYPSYNEIEFYNYDPHWLRHGDAMAGGVNGSGWIGEGSAMNQTPTTSWSGRLMTPMKYRNQAVDCSMYHGHQVPRWMGEHARHQGEFRYPFNSAATMENQFGDFCDKTY